MTEGDYMKSVVLSLREALERWLHVMDIPGITTVSGMGLFIDFLADEGYHITPITDGWRAEPVPAVDHVDGIVETPVDDESEFTRCSIAFITAVIEQLVTATVLMASSLDHDDDITLAVSPQVWRVVEPELVNGYLETPLDRRVRVVKKS